MRVPDYITPVVAYRLWQWGAAGLKSLNGAVDRRTTSVGTVQGVPGSGQPRGAFSSSPGQA
jgi:hypothetical protein